MSPLLLVPNPRAPGDEVTPPGSEGQPYRCTPCSGRGWAVHYSARLLQSRPASGIGTPVPCPHCQGAGGWSLRGLAKFLGVDHRTLERLEYFTVRPATAVRILEKMTAAGLGGLA
jgi:hypothetical protein